MSILAEQTDTLRTYEQAQQNLLGYLGGGGILMIAALICPKDIGFDEFRPILAGIFFLGLITLIWSAAEPLETFLRAWAKLALEDFGSESRSMVLDLVDSVSSYLTPAVWILTTAVGLIALRVGAAWPLGSTLLPVMPLIHLSFWLTACALPVYLFSSTNSLAEIFSLWRICRRQLRDGGFKARTVKDAQDRRALLDGPPLVVTGPQSFQAGGIVWTWADFYQNTIVFGEPGSGKTVTILNSMLDGLLSSANENHTAASALILDPKGDFMGKIGTLCRRLQRQADLRVIDPNIRMSERWNPFDNRDPALEIEQRFSSVLSLISNKGEDGDAMWTSNASTFIRHSIGLLRIVKTPSDPPSFMDINALCNQDGYREALLLALLGRATLGLREALEPKPEPDVLIAEIERQIGGYSEASLPLLASGLFKSLSEKVKRNPTQNSAIVQQSLKVWNDCQIGDLRQLRPGTEGFAAFEFMVKIWPETPDKTRGGIQAYLNPMINQFLTEPYTYLFSGKSTLDIGDILDNGRIAYINMPVADRTAMSIIICTLIKCEFYRQVLQRLNKTRPSLFLCDEFQTFFTSDARNGDAPFFERSRQSNHANLVATQNLSALLRVVKSEDAVIDNFLGNCATKVFLRNSEIKTLEYVEKVFGQFLGYIVTVGRGSVAIGGLGGLLKAANIQVTAQQLPRVAAERIIHLAKPDRGRGNMFSEAIVRIGSRSQVVVERLLFKVHPLDR